MQEDRHRAHLRMSLPAGDQLFGLLEASLTSPESREPGQRVRRERSTDAAVCLHGGQQLRLRGLPLTTRDQHAGVDGAAERRQRYETMRPRHVADIPTPPLGAPEIGDPIAGEEHRAAGRADRPWIGQLATDSRGHALVEEAHTLLQVAEADLEEPELAEAADFAVQVAEFPADRYSPFEVACCLLRGSAELPAVHLQLCMGGAERCLGEQSLGAREPATRDGLVAQRGRVLDH